MIFTSQQFVYRLAQVDSLNQSYKIDRCFHQTIQRKKRAQQTTTEKLTSNKIGKKFEHDGDFNFSRRTGTNSKTQINTSLLFIYKNV